MSSVVPSGRKHDFEDEQEYYEERAGILEYDAGLTRDEAERQARVETLARYFDGQVVVLLAIAADDGIALYREGTSLHVAGPTEARRRWLPTLQRFRSDLLSHLSARASRG